MAEEEVGGPARFLPDSLQALMVRHPGMAGGADARSTANMLTADHSQRSTLNSMGEAPLPGTLQLLVTACGCALGRGKRCLPCRWSARRWQPKAGAARAGLGARALTGKALLLLLLLLLLLQATACRATSPPF
jgi:hypothetical protein